LFLTTDGVDGESFFRVNRVICGFTNNQWAFLIVTSVAMVNVAAAL
jgi:hypothetical protein